MSAKYSIISYCDLFQFSELFFVLEAKLFAYLVVEVKTVVFFE